MLSRRRFILGAVGAVATVGLYTSQIEPRWVQMTTRMMPIRNLPTSLEGASLVQISDIHIGNRFDYQYVLDVMRGIQANPPDFVVYTGDFVSYQNEEQLRQLRDALPAFPQGKRGTAAILGNHDYGHGWQEESVAQAIIGVIHEAGIPVLRNEVVTFDGLAIGGMDDLWGTNVYPEKVMAQITPDTPAVVLAHNPDTLDLPIWDNYHGWVLSGHTHGGQIKPPFLPPPVIPCKNRRYTAGIFTFENGRTLYINRGIGTPWQMRFNVRPEVTRFVLTTM